MNDTELRIWYDDVGNRLTVTWRFKPGYYIHTEDERVLVQVDMDGEVQGFQVENLSSLKDNFLVAKRETDWWDRLGKDNRGSRPRCVLLTDGNREEAAQRLTGLINIPGVIVCPDDQWIPCGKPVKREDGSWDKKPAKEVQLDKPNNLVSREIQQQLQTWWLAAGRGTAPTPNWDIASTCTVEGKKGLLLVEAKAHGKELPEQNKCGSGKPDNLAQIVRAIARANSGLHTATESQWNLSRDSHYQLFNRFAWAWKLASLGIPVVLIYLGFLKAQDMAGRELFQSAEQWEDKLKDYCDGVVDNTCWGRRLDISGTPLLPLIRSSDVEFYP